MLVPAQVMSGFHTIIWMLQRIIRVCIIRFAASRSSWVMQPKPLKLSRLSNFIVLPTRLYNWNTGTQTQAHTHMEILTYRHTHTRSFIHIHSVDDLLSLPSTQPTGPVRSYLVWNGTTVLGGWQNCCCEVIDWWGELGGTRGVLAFRLAAAAGASGGGICKLSEDVNCSCGLPAESERGEQEGEDNCSRRLQLEVSGFPRECIWLTGNNQVGVRTYVFRRFSNASFFCLWSLSPTGVLRFSIFLKWWTACCMSEQAVLC